jgi:hypothetical protein
MQMIPSKDRAFAAMRNFIERREHETNKRVKVF